jgi:hypothetical protein
VLIDVPGQVTPSSPAIPYRTDMPMSMGHLVVAMLVTALVLAALVGALIYIRRRGWLGTIQAGRVVRQDTTGIELRATRRISMATTAHVVAYQGQDYLIVECARGVTATATTIPRDPATQSDLA